MLRAQETGRLLARHDQQLPNFLAGSAIGDAPRSSHHLNAGLWEPYDGRPSRTVLRGEGLRVRLAADARATALTPAQIESLVAELGGVAAVPHQATPDEKLATYDTLGLRLVYDDRNQQVKASVDLSRVANRVGGGTWPRATREIVFDVAA